MNELQSDIERPMLSCHVMSPQLVDFLPIEVSG